MDLTLQSGRLAFKEITWGDLDEIHRLHCIPEVDEFNTLGIPKNIDETRDVIRSSIEDRESEVRKEIQWTIRSSDNQSFIGLAGMTLAAERFKMAEIFYKILPAYWGQGLGTEVAQSLLKFGFEELMLHRIDAGVHIDNLRSIRVLEKIGMSREGRHRQILPVRGEWYDNYHYAILETDPRS